MSTCITQAVTSLQHSSASFLSGKPRPQLPHCHSLNRYASVTPSPPRIYNLLHANIPPPNHKAHRGICNAERGKRHNCTSLLHLHAYLFFDKFPSGHEVTHQLFAFFVSLDDISNSFYSIFVIHAVTSTPRHQSGAGVPFSHLANCLLW